MGRSIVERVIPGAVCFVAVFAVMVGQTIAETTPAKKSASVATSAKPATHQSKQGQYPPIHRAKKSPIPPATARQPEAIQKQAKSVRAGGKLRNSKKPRQMNVHKKAAPKAVVQSRTDLMYYGLLESP
ncbi:MAG: hypothetical protein ABI988_01825, partial [Nitrospirota bacterium]